MKMLKKAVHFRTAFFCAKFPLLLLGKMKSNSVHIKFIPIFVIWFLTACNSAPVQDREEVPRDYKTKIDLLLKRYLDLGRFSGSALIAKESTIIYYQSFGMADYGNDLPFTEQTSFKIGSASELLCELIIKDLVSKEMIQLDDSIRAYLPELHTKYTIKDLLHHRTNWPSIASIKEQHSNLDYAGIQFAQIAEKSKVTTSRSELNYNVLGLMLENILKKNYQDILWDYSQKWKLENTYYQPEDSLSAKGYLIKAYDADKVELAEAPSYNIKEAFSSRGIKSSAPDLLKIINLNAAAQLDLHSYLENDGFSFSLLKTKEDSLRIIILSNRRHPVSKEITESISRILIGEDFHLPLERKRLAMPVEALQVFEGTYALNEAIGFSVKVEEDRLFVLLGPKQIELIPQSESQFFLADQDASMLFKRDSEGTVKSVQLFNGFKESDQEALKL